MIINTAIIPEGSSEAVFIITNSEEYPQWPLLAEPVKCECRFDRNGADISVGIEFAGAFKLECSRCLKEFANHVSGYVTVILENGSDKMAGSSDDDKVVFFYSSGKPEVDISPAVYDEAMTSLPIMPLCSETCVGIVADGLLLATDVTSGKKRTEIDPRWEALKKLSHGKKS